MPIPRCRGSCAAGAMLAAAYDPTPSASKTSLNRPRKALSTQDDEAIYELSMICDRLNELDNNFSQQKSPVGIDGKPIDKKACQSLAACVEKAITVADAIAVQHREQTPPFCLRRASTLTEQSFANRPPRQSGYLTAGARATRYIEDGGVSLNAAQLPLPSGRGRPSPLA